ncbi:alpha/beta hydrolase [Actinoplanes sp. NPDC026619]|uniref:alpha/beta hydrolase n=1 Tax=Actinoplanes sp. NPDC026619 TaxID=3155798 RepID=UPI0033DD2B96
MTTAVYARLRVTEPTRWRAAALSWRRWAALAGRLAADLATGLARIAAVWSGAAASAALASAAALRRRLVLFRVLCWQADQATSEFASALERAKRLLARAAARGVTIEDDGSVHSPTGSIPPIPSAAAGAALTAAASEVAAALAVAAQADDRAAARLERIAAATHQAATPPPDRPACTASPAEVRRWWAGLTTAERQWLLATEPSWLAPLDGIPAADRDAANRLLLDDRRAEVDRALTTATGGERDRLREIRHGLGALADRLADEEGPRAYLLRLDLSEEGRTVVALGDPDQAANVVTHVPGMTADLASFTGELSRAARVAERATELSPAASTSAVLWLDYDAPDFVGEAASARRAEAGAPALRRFLEGIRATQDDTSARHTLIGHSYGSLVVGKAATGAGLAADEVVFVGSPGVGVDSAGDLAVPAGHVWSSTSHSDVIQYAAPSPGSLLRKLELAGAVPVIGPALAFGSPSRDLWFGHNPSDPAFGAHQFPSSVNAGHLGYWDAGGPSLDALASITLGTAR